MLLDASMSALRLPTHTSINNIDIAAFSQRLLAFKQTIVEDRSHQLRHC